MIWKAAISQGPPTIELEKYGWELDETEIKPVTGIKVACPPEIMKIIACGCDSQNPCSHAKYSCRSSGSSCTLYCKCKCDDSCSNEFTMHVDNHEDDMIDSDEE